MSEISCTRLRSRAGAQARQALPGRVVDPQRQRPELALDLDKPAEIALGIDAAADPVAGDARRLAEDPRR
jgi:hypothetical protein